MAVPDTTTFELQDVVDEVNPTTDDLVDCFADAIASKFDSAYEGSKNQLLNFRNYGAVTCTSFLTSSFTFRLDACTATPAQQNATYYHNGPGTIPNTGSTVYTDSSCTTTVGEGKRPYYVNNGDDPYYQYTTNASGVVTGLGFCGI